MKFERNALCPCGSGKKYKRCCGLKSVATVSAAVVDKARQAYDKGDWRETLHLCNEILAQDSREPTANHLYGLAELQRENFADAVKFIAIAAKFRPRDAFIHNSLGMALHRKGNRPEAEKEFRAALEIEPALAEAHNNLGNLLRDMQRPGEAVEHFRKAITLDKTNVLFVCNLGALYQGSKEYGEAETCYLRAIQVAPRFSPAYANLGVLYLQQDRFKDAVDYLHRAETLSPPDAHLLNNLGLAWYRQKEFDRSIGYYRRALSIQPDFVQALINLGLALEAKADYAEAAVTYREAIRLRPGFFQAYQDYFKIELATGAMDEAHDLACSILGNSELRNPLLPELIHVFGQACDFERRDKAYSLVREQARANLIPADTLRRMLLSLNYMEGVSPAEMIEYHRYWARDVESHTRQADWDLTRRPAHGRRIRIGYVSPDFREHAVGFFMRNIIANHDKTRFRIYCYANSHKRDAITEFIETLSDQYRIVVHLVDKEFSDLIRQDEIDILVDLSGHTGESRLPAFASKPAPVQMTYLGYPNTTAMAAMDYRISDPYVDMGSVKEFTEELLILPECLLSFGNFDESSNSTPSSLRQHDGVVYGSFNNLMKITPPAVRLWAAILSQVPNSRMLIKAKGADTQVARQHLLAEFSRHGIASNRIEMAGMVASHQEHREFYKKVDIALDTFPYQGTTTTCEALWMGVPVVVLVGQTHRQRVGYSILKNANIEETIAFTEEEYIAKAVRLAHDRRALERLKSTIKDRLRGSILCNPLRFTRQLEEAYLQAWEQRMGKGSSAIPPGTGCQ